MPNWCYTSATITGPTDDLTKFVKAIIVNDENGAPSIDQYGNIGYDITRLYPCPEPLSITARFFTTTDDEESRELNRKYESNIEEYGHAHWYSWCNDKWGTKWPPSITSFDHLGDKITTTWETAWSPATPLLLEVSKQFPTLVFFMTHTEEANFFIGAEACVNGEYYESMYSLEPSRLDALPEPWGERIRLAEERMELINGDWDHEMYDEYQYQLNEAYSDFGGWCESEVYDSLKADGHLK